ncbi:TPA: YmiA family putative membrane protein [Escherichia coli]|nr:YmiA family putative membrane protein [Escherichia coli]
MPSGNQEPRRDPELKRKAWLAVFLVSNAFWKSGTPPRS